MKVFRVHVRQPSFKFGFRTLLWKILIPPSEDIKIQKRLILRIIILTCTHKIFVRNNFRIFSITGYKNISQQPTENQDYSENRMTCKLLQEKKNQTNVLGKKSQLSLINDLRPCCIFLSSVESTLIVLVLMCFLWVKKHHIRNSICHPDLECVCCNSYELCDL